MNVMWKHREATKTTEDVFVEVDNVFEAIVEGKASK